MLLLVDGREFRGTVKGAITEAKRLALAEKRPVRVSEPIGVVVGDAGSNGRWCWTKCGRIAWLDSVGDDGDEGTEGS